MVPVIDAEGSVSGARLRYTQYYLITSIGLSSDVASVFPSNMLSKEE